MTMDSNTKKDKQKEQCSIPDPIKNMTRDGHCSLRAIGQLLVDTPNYDKLDSLSQLIKFASSLIDHLTTSKPEDPESNGSSLVSLGSFFVKSSVNNNIISKAPEPSQVAASACLAPIMSDTQNHLLKSYSKVNVKMDWKTARELRLPFWLRSDDKLKKISEEIGQEMFKRTGQTFMKCC